MITEQDHLNFEAKHKVQEDVVYSKEKNKYLYTVEGKIIAKNFGPGKLNYLWQGYQSALEVFHEVRKQYAAPNEECGEAWMLGYYDGMDAVKSALEDRQGEAVAWMITNGKVNKFVYLDKGEAGFWLTKEDSSFIVAPLAFLNSIDFKTGGRK